MSHMLKQREITRLLEQVVSQSELLENGAVISASLLSAKGLPLITVGPNDDSNISPDTLRLFSLMAADQYKQQQKTGDENIDNWAVLEVNKWLKAVIRKFTTTSSGDRDHQNTFFTVLFYNMGLTDAHAKVRLDLVTDALAAGLSGYRSN